MGLVAFDLSHPQLPPQRFRALGDTALLRHPLRLGIIGTRSPSDASLGWIRALLQALTRHVPLVVSGAALGTDMAAHTAAISQGLPTLAVLPCGLHHLRSDVRELGSAGRVLLLSPFPDDQETTTQTPVIRNRVIAALSQAIIAFEASEASGTFHCVRDAMALGVPVFFLRLEHPTPALASVYTYIEARGAVPFTLASRPQGLASSLLDAARGGQQRAEQLELFGGQP